MATNKQYLVRLGAKTIIEVQEIEFITLRGMKDFFEWNPSKPQRLRVKPQFVAWKEGDEYRFQNKITSTRFSVSIPSSWQLVEKAAVFATGGIREASERQRAIQQNYGPVTRKNRFSYIDSESFGTLGTDSFAGNSQSTVTTGEIV